MRRSILLILFAISVSLATNIVMGQEAGRGSETVDSTGDGSAEGIVKSYGFPRDFQLTKGQLANGWIELTGNGGVPAKLPDEIYGWQAKEDSFWRRCGSADAFCFGDSENWLMTTTEWSDFELIVDYSAVDEAYNSGVFIRTPLEPKDPKKDCYEINIAPSDNPFPTGSLVGRQKAKQDVVDFRKRTRMRIVAEGPRIRVWMNDVLVADYTDANPILKGHIGLQYREGLVLFKKVLLRPLVKKPLFNGKDLEGWKDDLAGPAKFSVTDGGELHVQDGPGQVESKSLHDDFVLQFACKTNGEGLNSGMFFRSIPGDRMNGYECQIQNKYEGDDRTKPVDFGTGAIYRRVKARMVNANDNEWFYVTLHADGPHIAAWVNGRQVTDWTDTRKPDKNPRKGLRLEPGSFCIQAHDPTTDLLFRDIRILDFQSKE